MENNSPQENVLPPNTPDIVPVTYERVRARAAQLAVEHGQAANDVSPADWERARRDLTGEPAPVPAAGPTDAIQVSEPRVHGEKSPA